MAQATKSIPKVQTGVLVRATAMGYCWRLMRLTTEGPVPASGRVRAGDEFEWPFPELRVPDWCVVVKGHEIYEAAQKRVAKAPSKPDFVPKGDTLDWTADPAKAALPPGAGPKAAAHGSPVPTFGKPTLEESPPLGGGKKDA